MEKSKNSRNYVLNHQYGYGKNCCDINKLLLRNLEDLEVYLADVVDSAFYAKYQNKTIKFNVDKSKFKLVIKKCT